MSTAGFFLLTVLLLLSVPALVLAAPLPGGTLDPTTIDKYVEPLVIPPAMPMEGTLEGGTIDYYEIAVRQFDQQVLPEGLPETTVWSYGPADNDALFHFPAFTIEADVDRPVRVKWINDLVDEAGNYLPHLLPVDQTLHWANPPGGPMGRDMEGDDPDPYDGPVPIITHVHGAHVGPESDGFPEAWYLPDAANIPEGYATRGTHWGQIAGAATEDGAAYFQYPNQQPATTLWYHDHALGMTRVNVYAGPAGFYMLRGGENDLVAGELPGPAPQLNDPADTDYYEIPLAIQDRSFNEDGSLFYPDNRAFFEGLEPDQLQIPFRPAQVEYDGVSVGLSDVPPIWNPEFFGNTMLVNGHTWPYLDVEPRRYRLRLLNGMQSRFLILKMVEGDGVPADPVAEPAALDFWQIAAEESFLPEPVELEEVLMGPAERADVIVDFSEYEPGDTLTMLNLGPDEPFGGGVPGTDFPLADPDTTGQVMQFRVVELAEADTTTDPEELELPAPDDLGEAVKTRKLSLNELESENVLVGEENGDVVLDEDGLPFGPTEAQLGILEDDGTPVALGWDEPLTETPVLGETEIWEFNNFTEDAHPIHIHMVRFQVVNRQTIDTDTGQPTGQPRPPEAWESGFKDTVISYPGEVARVKAKFDIAGMFVWHCHILEHEDNEMMRPFAVSTEPPPSFPDVPEDHRFHDAIIFLAERGIVQGYENGLFGPEDHLLRAQIAKIAAIAFGLHDDDIDNQNDPTFPDVDYDGDVYPFDYVEEAAEGGLVLGFTDGTFGPWKTLTRIQLLRILVRGAGDSLEQPPADYQLSFTDIAPEDVQTVELAKFNELIDGKSATIFAPYEPATRGHVAKILYNILLQMDMS
jgi:FtsP/CotA-like multicopper oxidase with cupredoxin domain